MKTLRVCLSSDLPGLLERDKNYLYFAYDKLFLYAGQNLLDVNFAIVSAIPESQVIGMMYILDTDGSVHRKIDYTDVKIAEIENTSQIELLKKAGTMYYVDANHRYMDSQQRLLTLPYNNGKYELTVAAKNDAMFTNDTILKYNENDERFELYSDIAEEFIDYSKPFRGKETDTAKVVVDGPRITANIKVSNAIGNILKASYEGLFVKPNGFVDRDTFNKWSDDVYDFKKYAQNILDKVEAELQSLEKLITPESIHEEIMTQLRAKYPTIDTALENYQQVVDSLDDIEENVMNYSSTTIQKAKDTIENTVATNSAWNNLDNSHSTYESEIDYYKKAEEYYYPELPRTKVEILIAAGIGKYIQDKGSDYPDKKIKALIGLGVAKYIEDSTKIKVLVGTAIAKYKEENK